MESFDKSKHEKEALFHHTYLKALLDNKNNLSQWQSYKEKYEEVIKNLKFYNEKNKHSICIPVGKKAFVKGELVHTNDVWVTLGCGWFLKTSSKKAIEICERRIKEANELIEKWEKENKLLESMRNYSMNKDTFGGEGSKEIVEPFDEEKERNWKKEHREKERKYRQQLKELKEKTSSPVLKNEKDLWEHLEALEIQEELEDELNRLECSGSSENDSDDLSDDDSSATVENSPPSISPIKNSILKSSQTTEKSSIPVAVKNSQNVEKKVTFKDVEENDDELITNNKRNEPVQNAVLDVVVEKVINVPTEENEQIEKRPMSKFKMKKLSSN